MRSATLLAFVDWRPSAVKSTIVYCLWLGTGDAPRAASARVPGLPLRSIGYEQRCAALPSGAGRPLRTMAQRQPLVGGYMQNPWLWL